MIKLLLLSCLICLQFLCGNCTNLDDTVDDKNCTDGKTHRVIVEFSTKIVQNEYIVTFDGYYKIAAREKFIRSALNGSKVSQQDRLYVPIHLH
jgi:membrane-bound transcription factor site-1 protease